MERRKNIELGRTGSKAFFKNKLIYPMKNFKVSNSDFLLKEKLKFKMFQLF